jgi:hypothetical protein
MAQNDPQAEGSIKSPTLDLFPAAFAETGKHRVEDMINFQTWLARMQSEAVMTSEFVTKLAAARSFPETATVCQEWTNRCAELLAQDCQRLFADTKKVMEAGARVLANGRSEQPWGESLRASQTTLLEVAAGLALVR